MKRSAARRGQLTGGRGGRNRSFGFVGVPNYDLTPALIAPAAGRNAESCPLVSPARKAMPSLPQEFFLGYLTPHGSGLNWQLALAPVIPRWLGQFPMEMYAEISPAA